MVLGEGVDALGIVLASLMVIMGIRGLLAGAVGTPEYLEIRNILSTRRVPWSGIDGFEIANYRVINYPVVAARSVDGSLYKLGMFCAPGPAAPAMKRVRKALAEIEALRPCDPWTGPGYVDPA